MITFIENKLPEEIKEQIHSRVQDILRERGCQQLASTRDHAIKTFTDMQECNGSLAKTAATILLLASREDEDGISEELDNANLILEESRKALSELENLQDEAHIIATEAEQFMETARWMLEENKLTASIYDEIFSEAVAIDRIVDDAANLLQPATQKTHDWIIATFSKTEHH